VKVWKTKNKKLIKYGKREIFFVSSDRK